MIMFTPEKIRVLRKALGFNTTQFAAVLGVTANAVDRWEAGERHPRYETMVKMNELADEKDIDLSDKAVAKAVKALAAAK
jgi:transcriptional regulator with XRE-family HTH domain